MPTSPAPRATAEAITAVIADRVRELREQAGLSQVGLAEAMGELGIPWKRATVVNLENRGSRGRGRAAGRDAVTVEELLALALVLDAPPATLLGDPRRGDKVEIGHRKFNHWQILGWLVGRTHLFPGEAPGDDVTDSSGWETSHALLTATNGYWDAIAELSRPDAVEMLGEDAPGLAKAQAAIEQRRRDAIDVITRLHEEMQNARKEPPRRPGTVRVRAGEPDVEISGEGSES